MIDAIADIGMSSINEGKIPKILKIGWISPIWKGNERDIPSDYRPISLTSHIGKLIERIVRHQLTIYLEVNNLIDNEQHGSRTGRSTLSQLLTQHDDILTQLIEGNNVDLLFLDFSKAFDVVDHSILLKKMKYKGIHGKLLYWISEFLTNREQLVRVGSSLSEPVKIISGVPQGSVLGPLLFLIFVSDLGENLDLAIAKILKYVDDSKILGKIATEEDVFKLQDEVNSIYSWATLNNMSWNHLKL